MRGKGKLTYGPFLVLYLQPQPEFGGTYQVMLTPDGDTRGLYVASKTATAFVVREVEGGRGSFDFDYHIYATTLGHARERMALVSGAAPAGPRAPMVRSDAIKPALPAKPN